LKHALLVGSYTKTPNEPGIHLVEFDDLTGGLVILGSYDGGSSPSYLASRGGLVYAVNEMADRAAVSTLKITQSKNMGLGLSLVDTMEFPGAGACHIALHPTKPVLFVSNYLSGNFVSCRLHESGIPQRGTMSHWKIGEGGHAHCAAPTQDGQGLALVDLGLGIVEMHSLCNDLGSGFSFNSYSRISLNDGHAQAPRHIIFHPDMNVGYIVTETSNHVIAAAYDPAALTLTPFQTISILPDGITAKSHAAAIRLSPDGKTLYASVRGCDVISILGVKNTGELEFLGGYPCGNWVRDFCLSPNGDYLFAAGQKGNILTVHSIDSLGGASAISEPLSSVSIQSPACVLVQQGHLVK